MAESTVEVIVQIEGEDVLAGRLWSHRRRGTESATFAYEPGYLGRPDAYELDPALGLSTAPQQTAVGQGMFGALSDCAPDRWGRRLIARAERRRIDHEGGVERSFGEIDYLLGVRDDLRQGALRFRDPATDTYLAEERGGVPPLLELPKLLNAAEHLERDEEGEEELRTLLRGGSSLGGSRPKAHVLDAHGRVAIAKFPRAEADDWDVMRWEAVALRLARAAEIDVPDWTLQIIDDKAVLIVDRFDRRDNIRIGYVSAMTMLEAQDGEHGSYLDIADVIERHSPTAETDLHELWRRVAFSVLISNTDDHLRNHGFLRLDRAGWSLAPAFDLNPNPRPGAVRLCTAIDFDDATASVDTLLGVAPYFRLNADAAHHILGKVSDATGRWRAAANDVGLGRSAIEQMAPAFEHDRARHAREIRDSK